MCRHFLTTKRRTHRAAVSLDRYQVCGLKLKNTTHALLATCDGDALVGPEFLWEWKADAWTELMGGVVRDGHDLQWAYNEDAVWSPGSGQHTVGLYATNDGAAMRNTKVAHTSDVNHVQLIEKDTIAIVSSRGTNSIIKVRSERGCSA